MDGEFQLVDEDESHRRLGRRPVAGERQPGSGRQKGTPNKSTIYMRDLARRIVENSNESVEQWLLEVANGKPNVIVDPGPDGPGGIIPGIEPNPAKAVELFLKVAEFGYAKAASGPGALPMSGDPDDDGDDAVPMLPSFNVTIEGS